MLQPLAALCRPAMLPIWGTGGGYCAMSAGAAPRPSPSGGPQEGVIEGRVHCSAATVRCTSLASSPCLSRVVRDLIQWGHSAGPWPCPRAGRQTGSSPGGQPGPAAWLPGEGDRGQERAAVLQPLEAPRWPAAPASPRWCEIRSGGRAAGPWRWPYPRTGRQTEAITWWAARSAAWFPGARSAATARGTPLACSPSLSLVVRDLIRLACCWVMAMAMSPDGTADRGHHLVGGALGGLVPRSAL